MLKIKNLTAQSLIRKPLLKDLNLEIGSNETHVIIGPKFAGKSAVVHAITGHPGIDCTSGGIQYKRKRVLGLDPAERFKLGIFTLYQVPPEYINIDFRKIALSVFKGEPKDFDLSLQVICQLLNLDPSTKEKFSGSGSLNYFEAKMFDVVLMWLAEPDFVIVDELDYGLSQEQTLLAGAVIKTFLESNKKSSLFVTNNIPLIELLNPTQTYVLAGGMITASGPELYKRIVEDGYSEFS
jgi:Fe-S cluster assembly ATP-binding protein